MSLKTILADLAYNLYQTKILKNPIHVKAIDDTIGTLMSDMHSIVRFGDGEFKLISGKDIANQKASHELSQRLKSIISSENPQLLIALPDIFDGLDQYVPSSRSFWKEHLLFHRKDYIKYCPAGLYENSFISRPYIMYEDKQRQALVFSEVKKLWNSRDVVFIEGNISHNAVDNDLFDNASSIRRIIAPSENAFNKYDDILKECLKLSKNDLILVTLGAAGKVLTADLVNNGYRVLDIGSLDMEYGWYLEGATRKCRVPKHEVVTYEDNIAAGYHEYLSQIIADFS